MDLYPRTSKVAVHATHTKSDYKNARARCRYVINGAQGARYSERAPAFGSTCGVALRRVARCASRCCISRRLKSLAARVPKLAFAAAGFFVRARE